MRFLQNTLLSAGLLNADFDSAAIDCSYVVAASLVITTSSTSTSGVVKLQASNDPANQLGGPVNWVDIPSATVTMTSAGNYIVPKTDISYQWVRAVFTSGGADSGTLTINMKALGF